MTARPARAGVAPIIDAIRVEGDAAAACGFTYTVLIDRKPAATPARAGDDRREAPRRRTRLRSGKIVDAADLFVTECLVHDLSDTGMRLRLPIGVAMPDRFQVYDDQSGQLLRAELSWRRADEVGIHFVPYEETPRSRTIAADMRRKFYKLPR
ncbi:PilZ domain-containing protein [Lichenihabitans sp. Uapishka_5]|uniref:PilZ domain-containing protein n=1 Tax=Lichenihabitans sp. Uapishka_5 TaxID=3037302 RepID=UPI0029E7ED8A|nr:PilZ domain-containing protein [Lichenihabitans sp. Uapishka_5]MDX7950352.1 PilZ domain-containing protein [Lichenihabitans sp. Uapishka_5]